MIRNEWQKTSRKSKNWNLSKPHLHFCQKTKLTSKSDAKINSDSNLHCQHHNPWATAFNLNVVWSERLNQVCISKCHLHIKQLHSVLGVVQFSFFQNFLIPKGSMYSSNLKGNSTTFSHQSLFTSNNKKRYIRFCWIDFHPFCFKLSDVSPTML